MKEILLSACLCLCFAALNLSAQTPSTPPEPILLPGVNADFLGFIPAKTNFLDASVELESGAASLNGQVANYIKLDYNWNPRSTNTLLVSGIEEQNAPVSTTIQNATIYPIGIRKAWQNAEIKIELAGRRNFAVTDAIKPSWQAGALFDANWFPVTGGHIAFNCGANFLTDPSKPLGRRPQGEIRGGATIAF